MFATSFLIWAVIGAVLTLVIGYIADKKTHLVMATVMFVVSYMVAWISLPPISPRFVEFWAMILFVSAIPTIEFVTTTGENRGYYGREPNPRPVIVPVAIILLIIIGSFAGSGWFFSQEKASILNVTNHGQKSQAINLVSQEKALRVTEGLAHKRAAELIGDSKKQGLASIAKYGEMWGNVIKEKPYWVAPLEPNGFWRWVSNPVTPGYVVVSQVNTNDAVFYEDKPIAYGPGFYFAHDLGRHLYINGYVNYSYGEMFFQVDDNGTPFYVVPLERPQIVFSADYPVKWVVVNAMTGEIKEYDSPKSLPEWIDRVFPKDTIISRLEDWGCFSQGPWACYVSGVNVIDPTPGLVVTMNESGEMVYYTGTQFQNNKVEGATSGVTIINARTGKAEFYRRAGITERAAVNVMNGAVANFAGRSAENPVLIHVNGRETYFSVITDANGAQKGFGMVWQRNRNVFGVGNSVESALRAYLRSMRTNGKSSAFDGNAEIQAVEFKGIVVTITPVTRAGETAFYVRIDTVPEKVFVVNTDNPAEVAVTMVGQKVSIKAINADPAVIDVDEFDNLDIKLKDSALQVKMDKDTKVIKQRARAKEHKRTLDNKLKGLTPKQVDGLLKSMSK